MNIKPLSPEKIQEIQSSIEIANQLEWFSKGKTVFAILGNEHIKICEMTGPTPNEDAHLISQAPTYIKILLAEINRLKEIK